MPCISVVLEKEGKREGRKAKPWARGRSGAWSDGAARGACRVAGTPDPGTPGPRNPGRQTGGARALPARPRPEAALREAAGRSEPDPEPHPGAEATPGLRPPLRPLGTHAALPAAPRGGVRGGDGAWGRSCKGKMGWGLGAGQVLRRSCEARRGGA